MKRITADQFEALLLNPARRWLDVRAPIEFQAAAVPGALNLPLLSDQERHQVGLTYKQQGREAAIELGHRLVSGEIKSARVQAWKAALDEESIIYCFRGGLRSQITQAWLKEVGVDLPLIEGGYKELRRFLLESLERIVDRLEFHVVSGLTGSGKTEYLYSSGKPFLDLEKLAVHRGSAFGGFADRPQPTQGNFENAVAVELLRLARAGEGPVLIERESRMVGHCVLPASLHAKIVSGPRIEVEIPFERRVDNILRDYVETPVSCNADVTFEGLVSAVKSISRKLGDARAQEILADIRCARAEFDAHGRLEANRVWIQKLLEWYYDPMYRFAHTKSATRT